MTGKSLLYVVNVDWFFLSHRLAVARAARNAGYNVHVACGDTGRMADIMAEGFTVHTLRIDRQSTAIAGQLALLYRIARLIRSIRPHIVHLVTIKPVLLGGAAARLLRVPVVVAAISGLGHTFLTRDGFAAVRLKAIQLAYRFALSSPRVRVIFQNADDRALISKIVGLRDDRAVTIRGSGVDLERLQPSPLRDGHFVVVFAARLLTDKGLREFIAAARLLRARGSEARFIVAGSPDPHNPACVPPDELNQWKKEGVVEFAGQVEDIGALFAGAHVVALPSYREGMPLVLLEAAACGRAVVTTDVPGCRTAIEPGVSGLLVPVKNAHALADALHVLEQDRPLCAALGLQGRRLAERAFSIETVVRRHLAIYDGRELC